MSAPKRMLMVDDDDAIRDLRTMALTDEGYEVLVAADGQAALALVGQAKPDLILLDLGSPVMDGRAFLRAYRAQQSPHAPIIVCTAAWQPAAIAVQVCGTDYLPKPSHVRDLLAIVDAYAS
jgi:DNA-binding response OmpR family regulator